MRGGGHGWFRRRPFLALRMVPAGCWSFGCVMSDEAFYIRSFEGSVEVIEFITSTCCVGLPWVRLCDVSVWRRDG